MFDPFPYTWMMLIRDLSISLASIVASVSTAVVAYTITKRFRLDSKEREQLHRQYPEHPFQR